MNLRSKALGLIRCQSVHRINDNRLDTRRGRPLAVVKNRIHETLGLTRAGARSYQGIRSTSIGSQPLPGLLLVRIRRVLGLKAFEEIPARRAGEKWQADGNIRPLDNASPSCCSSTRRRNSPLKGSVSVS